jgi:hypothetical protein
VADPGRPPPQESCGAWAAAGGRLASSIVPSPLHALIAELTPTMRRGDLAGFQQIFRQLSDDGRDLRPDELSAAIGELAPILARKPEGVFARLALAAGAFVEWGGSPVPLADNAPTCAIVAMSLRVMFSRWWPVVAAGRPEPDPDAEPRMSELIDLFVAKADELRIGESHLDHQQAATVAVSWFDAPHWVNLMITLLARREFRDATDLLPEIGRIAAELGDRVPRAHWLLGLAQVLDDEPIVAIDQATGRGYRLTMSGVGDNFQLHTLLAHRLIGDPARGLLAGEPPHPAWVAAATAAPPLLPATAPTQRRFRLYDATGAYIHPEGRPADIAVVDGVRVVALHPPRGNYGWINGRTYEHMVPTLTLDGIITADEADAWRTRIAPARENDLFAPR